MINTYDILETIRMIQDECLDIRTTTMGISLLDCADTDIDKACAKVYDKICTKAEKLVQTGEDIEREYGIPIINKRVSVTPHCHYGRHQRRRPGKVRPGAGKSSPHHRGELYRRLQCPGTKGICRRRPGAD